MEAKSRQSGLTLTEMVVVIAIIALLVGLGVPAGRAFLASFETESGAKSMISAALASARAIAAKEQRYAGIRFQKAYDPAGLLEAPQYMVFILHDFEKTGLAPGFRAVAGLKPIKLPDSVGVMEVVNYDDEIDEVKDVRDKTTFSIVFSPSGKMVIHDVRVRNRDGVYRPDNGLGDPDKVSMDGIFNSPENITNYSIGMFIQDDYASLGLWKESSRRSFIIYEKERFKQAYKRGRAWSDYLVRLAPDAIYINPYTGTMIER